MAARPFFPGKEWHGTVDVFLQNLLNALQWGSFYALIALGYTLVYGVLLLINFAHGDIFMVGAYIGFFVASFFLGSTPSTCPWICPRPSSSS